MSLNTYFNTSNVINQLAEDAGLELLNSFQYIKCY